MLYPLLNVRGVLADDEREEADSLGAISRFIRRVTVFLFLSLSLFFFFRTRRRLFPPLSPPPSSPLEENGDFEQNSACSPGVSDAGQKRYLVVGTAFPLRSFLSSSHCSR